MAVLGLSFSKLAPVGKRDSFDAGAVGLKEMDAEIMKASERSAAKAAAKEAAQEGGGVELAQA